jgi:hypothetical protein
MRTAAGSSESPRCDAGGDSMPPDTVCHEDSGRATNLPLGMAQAGW